MQRPAVGGKPRGAGFDARTRCCQRNRRELAFTGGIARADQLIDQAARRLVIEVRIAMQHKFIALRQAFAHHAAEALAVAGGRAAIEVWNDQQRFGYARHLVQRREQDLARRPVGGRDIVHGENEIARHDDQLSDCGLG
ncbi:hypothetical protein DL770_011375 [Monosporascus sp. CRB-9-2]|nr:hypothetical protein DL770_011375 [Monosporascus sp. CRB-9-2]